MKFLNANVLDKSGTIASGAHNLASSNDDFTGKLFSKRTVSMQDHRATLTRRELLAAGTGMLGSSLVKPQNPLQKKTVAAVVTMYTDDRSLKSHASVIVGRMLEGYSPNNVRTEPQTRVVSMYTDQVPANDLSRRLSEKHQFKIYPTVGAALCLGGDKLAVDAVLIVGEHGNYPRNEKGQKLYPRYELMEQVVDVFRRDQGSVPVFSDKHLSYSWWKAKQMAQWSRDLRFPLMAGSSIPVTVRVPELEVPYNAEFENALAVGYGDVDAYGFHTLETLQCMVERRAGGEKGVASVQMLEGEEVWRWRDSAQGCWSIPLLNAALATTPRTKPGPPEQNAKTPVLILLEYRDGLHAAAYLLNGHTSCMLFAGKLSGLPNPVATHCGFVNDGRPLAHFDGLVHCIEEMFSTGQPPYPFERTLLTSVALSFLFESRYHKKRIQTPELKIAYRSPRETYFQTS